MSSSDDTPEQIPRARHVLAGSIDEEKGQGGAGSSNPGTVAAPPMPVPSVIFSQPCPQPTVASQFAAAHEALHPTVLSTLPEPLSGMVVSLKPSGYGARNTVDNMCALVAHLDDPSGGVKLVDRFIAGQQMTSH
ncbi:hypothetical protein TRAPUB_4144 [Trametes pubescens]|uniref:Uncharacterized protein n=1 Tax=Trametes pubescens TaxID=154538 RepID=A0A1M2VBV8_TRAPU|nr:hypothetical protein TRAPUB_4144 [Trametes pubescens]